MCITKSELDLNRRLWVMTGRCRLVNFWDKDITLGGMSILGRLCTCWGGGKWGPSVTSSQFCFELTPLSNIVQ